MNSKAFTKLPTGSASVEESDYVSVFEQSEVNVMKYEHHVSVSCSEMLQKGTAFVTVEIEM